MDSFVRAGFALAVCSVAVAAFVACSDDSSPATISPIDGGNTPVDSGGTTPATTTTTTDGGSPADQDSGTQTTPVTLSFKAMVGDAGFKCGQTYMNQGSTNESVTPQDLRMYVQDVQFVDDNGKSVPVTLDTRAPWQTPAIAYLDFEDGTGQCKNGNPDLNDKITGTVPTGTYKGVVFTIGVPEELDHADPLSAPPPIVESMTWGWLYGYRFLIAEMTSTSAPASPDAGVGLGLLHLGSVGCDTKGDAGVDAGVTCTQANRTQIRLDGFTPGTSTIVLDVANIFTATDLKASNECHSFGDACPSMFASVGLKYIDGTQISTQTAFHLE